MHANAKKPPPPPSLNLKSTSVQSATAAANDDDDDAFDICDSELIRASQVVESQLKFTVQTLFLREHNRIANELARINPRWDDNRLFFEARKILIGIYQNIIYSEWLPAIIGWNTAALFDLAPLNTSVYFAGYNSKVSKYHTFVLRSN